MATTNFQIPGLPQQIDYTNLDYESILAKMYELIPEIMPEWTDLFDSDFGVVLLQLYAYCSDILSYIADRNYNECSIVHAQLRSSIINMCRLVDYELKGASAARASVICKITPQSTDKVLTLFRCATEETTTAPAVEFESDSTPFTLNYMDVLAFYGEEDGILTTDLSVTMNDITTAVAPVLTPEDGDAFYAAFEHMFDVLSIQFTIPADYYFVTYQYWNGTAWTDLTVIDDTTEENEQGDTESLTSGGDIKWNIHSCLDWAECEVGDITAFWIRGVFTKVALPDPNDDGDDYIAPIMRHVHYRNGYSYVPVDVVQAVSVDPEFFSSTGDASQFIQLAFPSPVDFRVYVDEGYGFVEYNEVQNFIDSGPSDRDFYIQRDENDYVTVWFGDGSNAKIPPTGTDNIRIVYKTGGGAVTVSAGKITRVTYGGAYIDALWNPEAAYGGEDREDINSARVNAGKVLRTGWRCVTLEDFETLGGRQPGVGKVKAVAQYVGGTFWNQITCYVIDPSGNALTGDAKTDLIAFYEERKLLGYAVVLRDPTSILVKSRVTVNVRDNYVRTYVMLEVDAAIENFFAFENMVFGRNVFLGDFYQILENVEGVDHVDIHAFHRETDPESTGNIIISSEPDLEIARRGTMTLEFIGGN